MDLDESTSSNAGFSLVETMVAIGLLTAVTVSVAQLFAVATAANLSAKGGTSTAMLAAQKMEQLRELTWGFDNAANLGLPLTDTTTDLSTDPPTNTGSGLAASPADSLEQNTVGYVDYLDADGKWVGTGTNPTAATAYVRRWSVQPLPANPNNTLVLQVRVMPLREADSVGVPSASRMRDETWLVSVKTRKAP